MVTAIVLLKRGEYLGIQRVLSLTNDLNYAWSENSQASKAGCQNHWHFSMYLSSCQLNYTLLASDLRLNLDTEKEEKRILRDQLQTVEVSKLT